MRTSAAVAPALSRVKQLRGHPPERRWGSGELYRHALEALAVEESRCGHLSQAELRRLLGFETRGALDGFLKAREVFIDYTLDDLEQERQSLRRLGF